MLLEGVDSEVSNPQNVNPKLSSKYNDYKRHIDILGLFEQIKYLLSGDVSKQIQNAIRTSPERKQTKKGEELVYSSGMIFKRAFDTICRSLNGL